jgi:hypothetical protein
VAETFLRFRVADLHPVSQEPRGLFSSVWELEAEGRLEAHELAWWAELVAWFGVHLPQPKEARRSRRPGAPNRAVFWFRASATEHVSRMREVAPSSARHGSRVEVRGT